MIDQETLGAAIGYMNQHGGGGGTDVEANPPDEATDILSKLKVAGTTYSVQGGGGSTPIVNNEQLIFS